MYYFLSASLPEIRLGERPPMTLDEFDAEAEEQLTHRHYAMLTTGSDDARVIREMRRFEEYLRARIAKRRADKLNIPFDVPDPEEFRTEIETAVGQLGQLAPLEREFETDKLRWRMLDELAALDEYGFDHICAYRAKLQLAEKYRDRDAAVGKKRFDAAVAELTEKQSRDSEIG